MKREVNLEALKSDLRTGSPSEKTLSDIRILLGNADIERLNHLLVIYIEYAPMNGDEAESIVRLAHATDNAHYVEETLKGMSYRYYDSPNYRSLILHCLEWPHHDFINSIELAAINRLPKYFVPTPELRKVLAARLKSENPVVRDAVAEAVQAYAGVPDRKIWRTNGDGNLFSLLPPAMQKLLDI